MRVLTRAPTINALRVLVDQAGERGGYRLIESHIPPLPCRLLKTCQRDHFIAGKRNLRLQAVNRIARNLDSASVLSLTEERFELALLNIEIQAKPLNFNEEHKAENNRGSPIREGRGTSFVNSTDSSERAQKPFQSKSKKHPIPRPQNSTLVALNVKDGSAAAPAVFHP